MIVVYVSEWYFLLKCKIIFILLLVINYFYIDFYLFLIIWVFIVILNIVGNLFLGL